MPEKKNDVECNVWKKNDVVRALSGQKNDVGNNVCKKNDVVEKQTLYDFVEPVTTPFVCPRLCGVRRMHAIHTCIPTNIHTCLSTFVHAYLFTCVLYLIAHVRSYIDE